MHRSLLHAPSRVRVRQVLLYAVLGIALLYVPLGVTYMSFAFGPGGYNWQNAVTAAINGGDYAYRAGSVDSVRKLDYSQHRWVMLIHTVLGGLALLLMIYQLSPRLRRYSLRAHVWVGRVYFVLMTISMLTALTFLSLAGPADVYFGTPFHLQLWELAIGTLLTGFFGLWAIRRGNLLAHQAWMYLNFSLMMTAPLLRLVWMIVGPLFPQHALLDNLGLGSVLLSVVTPAGAVVALQFSLRSHRGLKYGVPTFRLHRAVALLLLAMAGSIALLGHRFVQVDDVLPGPLLWVPTGALLIYFTMCLIGAWRSARRRRWDLQVRWLLFAWGAVLGPLATLGIDLVVSVLWGAPAGVLAGLMVGMVLPLCGSYALVIYRMTARYGVQPQPQRQLELVAN